MTDECEVVVTRSGARAMKDHATGELMHPVVGPLVEALQLYVGPSRLGARLREKTDEPLVLLDVGLGAGSNAIAAWQASEASSGRPLQIVSFERSLAALELALHPENASAFGLEGGAGEAAKSLLSTGAHETARTRWRLVQGELPATLAVEPAASADIVFWDPFSPRSNPSLWTVAAFTELRRVCRPGVTVHTYSAGTTTRAALLLAGFVVGMGVTTGVDKESTIAALRTVDLERPLDKRWLARLDRSSAPMPSDAAADARLQIRALAQFA